MERQCEKLYRGFRSVGRSLPRTPDQFDGFPLGEFKRVRDRRSPGHAFAVWAVSDGETRPRRKWGRALETGRAENQLTAPEQALRRGIIGNSDDKSFSHGGPTPVWR